MHDDHSSIVPDNQAGASSDISQEVILADEIAADILFQKAKKRLLDVNRWHEWSGKDSAVFTLTDAKGDPVNRLVQLGDHFRINIQAPGNLDGNGYDWVQVEAIESAKDETGEVIAVRVRPADNPQTRAQHIAHFFSDEATSTFSVTITGRTVTAAVQGRNEKPNTGTTNIIDKMRNTIVAAGAMIGLNKPQWKSLVKGLLR